ncbi:MAG: enoyl-CoA hydratase/isomerase family protein [Burkholderiales bacterium]|jgi:enoyl-CoA hydratase/carnithine racemase|nr:enoyl-CoA hydratase/isomerase family protein [Burkholderiales bacterium]
MSPRIEADGMLQVEDDDAGIRTLVMNVPGKRNAMNPVLRAQLIAAVEDGVHDSRVRALVIGGANGDFCAGGDLGALSELPPSELPELLASGHRLLRAIVRAPKPVVAAIEGHAAGGGAGLALACDFVVMSRGARFGFPFLSIGLVPDWGLMYSLTRRAGAGMARRLLLHPIPVDAANAVGWGLADEIVEDGQAEQRAKSLAATLAVPSPHAWARTKQALETVQRGFDEALSEELHAQVECFGSEEFRRGVSGFLARRHSSPASKASAP